MSRKIDSAARVPGTLDEFCQIVCRQRSMSLCTQQGFECHEREDLQQELLLGLWKAIPSFVPADGNWEAWVRTVVRRLTQKLTRDRRRAKRTPVGELTTLDQDVESDDGCLVPLAEELIDRSSVEKRDGLSAQEIAIDVASILESLPKELRELAEDLKSESITSIATLRGVDRSQIHRQVDELREAFRSAGFGGSF